jgi:phospholipase C
MVVAFALAALCAVAVVPSMASASNGHSDKGSLQQFKHLVVIYESNGSSHLVDLIKAIESGPQAKDTLILVTYDEFGGQWDHVPSPGTPANPGPRDVFGPGTRIPVLYVSQLFKSSGVDHTQMDTTSILATIEHRFNLPSLTDPSGQPTRDAQVNDISPVIKDHR